MRSDERPGGGLETLEPGLGLCRLTTRGPCRPVTRDPA